MPLSTNPALLLDSCLHAIYLDRDYYEQSGLGRVSAFLSAILARECVGYEMRMLPWTNTDPNQWISDLAFYVQSKGEGMGYSNTFFRRTVLPLREASIILNTAERPDRRDAALAVVGRMAETEWRTAMVLWIEQQYGASNVVQRISVGGSGTAGPVGDQPDARRWDQQSAGYCGTCGNSHPECRCGDAPLSFISTGGEVP